MNESNINSTELVDNLEDTPFFGIQHDKDEYKEKCKVSGWMSGSYVVKCQEGMDKLKEYWRCKTYVQTHQTEQLHNSLIKIVSNITKKDKIIESTVEEIEKLFRRYND